MVNAKQIELTYRNNYVQACACISHRSLTGSEVLGSFGSFYGHACFVESVSFWVLNGPS